MSFQDEELEYLEMLMDPEFSHVLSSFASLIGQLKDAHAIMSLKTTVEHKYNLLLQLAEDLMGAFKQVHVAPINILSSSADREEMLEELYGRFIETTEKLEEIIA